MSGLDSIKNSLIDRILATKNEELLKAICNIFEFTQTDSIISLSSEQLEMLQMSEKDIECGNLVTDVELNKLDAEWLN